MKTIGNKILVIPEKEGNTKNELGLTLPGEFEIQGLEKVKVEYVGGDIKDPIDKELLIYLGAGTKVKISGKEYRVISITDIVVIL